MPVVLLFKGGVMYSFHGGGFSVERLMQFAERDYVHSSRMLVPPEPHVATPHDQTFLSSSRLIPPLGSGGTRLVRLLRARLPALGCSACPEEEAGPPAAHVTAQLPPRLLEPATPHR